MYAAIFKWTDAIYYRWCIKRDNYKPYCLTMLHRCIENNDTELLIKLLEHGVDIHQGDDHPLRQAVDCDSLEIIAVLLAHGAHVNSDCALSSAVVYGKLEIVTTFLEHGTNTYHDAIALLKWQRVIDLALLAGAGWGHLEIVIKLLKHGANIHFSDDCTLAHCVEKGHTKVVGVLLEYGANIYCKDNKILEDLKNEFNEGVAIVLLPYCVLDDYHYFSDWFIKAHVVSTKGSHTAASKKLIITSNDKA